MNEHHELRRAVDARLSGLTVSRRTQEELLRRAQEENQPMKKKLSVSLAFALVLLLALAATACAAAMRYGVLDFNSHQTENDAYIEHIVDVGQTYENDYFTLNVNEAVFDGASLSMTMDIQPVEGVPAVYVVPTITARAGDTPLELDIEGCTGGDFFSGFWVPQAPDWENGGQYGADYAVIASDEEGCFIDPTDGDVTWTMTFRVIRPDWPVSVSPVMLTGDDTDDPPIEDYMQAYRDAYDRQEILLSNYHSVDEYAAMVPAPEGMDKETWFHLPVIDQLTQCGAFSYVDTLTCTFTTGETGVRTAEPQTFDLGDYEVTLEAMTITFARADYRFSVRAKDESGAFFRDKKLLSYSFAVLSPDCTTSYLVCGGGVNGLDDSDPSVRFSGSVTLSAPTDTLTFVLCAPADDADYSPEHEVMRAQKILTEEQKAMSFTVTVP